MTRLVHVRSGFALADRLEAARTPLQRMRGLLGRDGLAPGQGMLIEQCSMIHTFFMRFALDVIFLDSDMVIRKAIRGLAPWRLAAALGSRHVVELPEGTLDRVDAAPGDTLQLEDPS